MKLIEKFVDEILDNEFYAFGIGALIVIICMFGSVTYKEKLDTEVKLDNLLKDSEKDTIKTLNEFKATKNLPLTEHTLDFFRNVWEYIEAVKRYDIEVEENHKKWLEIKNRIQINHEKPN